MKNSNSPIHGLGTDIIEIDRVRKSIERHGLHFLNRLFTQREQDYCYQFKDPVPHFAGRFAAKEAIVKALGTGFGSHVSWHDIEILNDERGRPLAKVAPQVFESLEKKGKEGEILVSISHSEAYATSSAIWVA